MVNLAPAVNTPAPQLLSKADAARALGVSVRTVHNLLTSGKLPAVRVVGRVLVEADDLRRFINESRVVVAN